MKRIIVCFDGTGNTFEPTSLSGQYPTNVLKMARMIAPLDNSGENPIHQIVLYLPGVGTSGTYDRCVNGLTGHGVELKLLMAYQFITDNYNFVEGDQIYLFGFSRGAFSARLLAGFLDVVKVIPKEKMHAFGRIYECYKRVAVGDKMTPKELKEFGEDFKILSARHGIEHGYELRIIPILFLGVWDTVTTVSAAAEEVGLRNKIAKIAEKLGALFHARSDEDKIGHPAISTLPHHVSYAYQALALHEIRSDFPPSLWEKADNGKVVQTWFPGSHSDVGGGYSASDLSNITLEWMIARARKHKLHFNPIPLGSASPSKPRFRSPIHESWNHEIWGLRPTKERTLNAALNEFRHVSVEARFVCNPETYLRDHQIALKRIDTASLNLNKEPKPNAAFEDHESLLQELRAYADHLEDVDNSDNTAKAARRLLKHLQ